jgi:surface protein
VPIVAWYDNGTLYYYTDADTIYLNQDSSSMFYGIRSGTYIDTSGWDTSRATNMYNMFSECRSLETLDVSDWDTSSVTSMNNMFVNCSSLT